MELGSPHNGGFPGQDQLWYASTPLYVKHQDVDKFEKKEIDTVTQIVHTTYNYI